MNYISSKSNKGFTLVELVVVVSIILILVSVVLASIAQARKNSRDKQRIADLSNVNFAVVVYREKNNKYPTGSDGIIGSGNTFDTAIAPYLADIPQDPLSNNFYRYRYNQDFTCTEPHQRVLYAEALENTKSANFSTVCTDVNAGDDYTGSYPGTTPGTTFATSNSYILILK